MKLASQPRCSHTREVEASGATLAELLADLDRQYPGIRFRVIDEQNNMRPHIRFFVNGEQAFDIRSTSGRPMLLCLFRR